MKRILVVAGLFLAAVTGFSQTGSIQGHCYLGGTKATTQGLPSANYLNGIIPACTVTVYLHGTNPPQKQTITTDGSTPLSNPFTANAVPGVDPGGWLFFSSTNQGVDIVLSGGNSNPACNTAPLCYTTPVTLVDKFPSGSLNPVSGVTSINSVSGAFTFTGNVNCVANSCNFTNGTTLQHNAVNLPNQALLNFLDAPASLNPPVTDTNQAVAFKNDTHGGLAAEVPAVTAGLKMGYTTPAAGQFAFLLPSSCGYSSVGSNPSGSGSCAADNSGGGIQGNNIGPLNPTSAKLAFGFTLPSYITQGNISAVYIAASYFLTGTGGITLVASSCTDGVGSSASFSNASGFQIFQQSVTQFSPAVPVVNSIVCTFQVAESNPPGVGVPGFLASGASMGIYVFYTGTAPPSQAAQVAVAPPLNYQTGNLSLSLPFNVGVDTSNTNSYNITLPALSNTYSQLSPGTEIIFIASNANSSTTPTLNLNGQHAYTIQKNGGALASGDIPAAGTGVPPSILVFDGLDWQLINPVHTTASNAAFSGLTSGTNTTAAMVVGSGGSLAASGSGTIAATSVTTPAGLPSGIFSCTEVWSGSGALGALSAGDDAISNNTCYNDSGFTRTITAVKARSDNASNTTTVNPTFGATGTGTTICSGALTAGSSYAYSATCTVSNAAWTTGTGIDPAMGGTLTGTSIALIVEYHY